MERNDCDYCLRNIYHGGGCSGIGRENCLIYQEDPRGKPIHQNNINLPVSFNTDVSKIAKGNTTDEYLIKKIRKTLRIRKVHRANWRRNRKNGLEGLYIECDISYWSNEDLDKENDILQSNKKVIDFAKKRR